MNYFTSSTTYLPNQVRINCIIIKFEPKIQLRNVQYTTQLLLNDIIHRNLIEILPRLVFTAKTEMANGGPAVFLWFWAPQLATCTLPGLQNCMKFSSTEPVVTAKAYWPLTVQFSADELPAA